MSERKAGRELDAEIAEKVMGQKMVTDAGNRVGFPHYSTSIADAWRVVERMRERGWHVRVDATDAFAVRDAGIASNTCTMHENLPDGGYVIQQADTAPLAICLAALAATSPDRGDER